MMRPVKTASVMAAIAGLLLLLAAPASAKKVYDYVYSGSYIDGASSTKGPFPAAFSQKLQAVGYDAHRERIFAAVGGEKFSYITKFTKAGVPDPFAAPGLSDTIDTTRTSVGQEIDIAIDNTGGAGDGNIYLANPFYDQAGYGPDGTELAEFTQFTDGVCGVAVDPEGDVWVGSAPSASGRIEEFDSNGVRTGAVISTDFGSPLAKEANDGKPFAACHLAIDSNGDFYAMRQGNFDFLRPAIKFTAAGEYLYDVGTSKSVRSIVVDPSTDNAFVVEGPNENSQISEFDPGGVKLSTFGGPADPVGGGIAVDPVSHDVWAVSYQNLPAGPLLIKRFVRTPPTTTVPTTTTGGSPDLLGSNGASATLHGVVNADGIATTDCQFEWGPTQALGSSAPCAEGDVFTGSEDNPVSATISGLTKGTAYYFRLNAKNENERGSPGVTVKFFAQDKPISEAVGVTAVNTDGVRLDGDVDPNGGPTTYHFEWGVDESYGNSTAKKPVGARLSVQNVSSVLTGLTADTTYHFRIVLENAAAITLGEDRIFRTYPRNPSVDPCPNAQVRKQTESSLLFDCRAYELVSAGNAGGYDVESDLLPGQSPFSGYPRAANRVLYGLHFGSVPGIAGSPTNYGLDPYVAVRSGSGWTTHYAGLPADGMPSQVAFGSPLLEADAGLHQFAFGVPPMGNGICEPCFADGSINIPLRLADGSVVKGMAGSRSPAANPIGHVAQRFSEDGRHFVFGADLRFETAGKNGEVSIYDRNLATGTTQVVSTLPDGQVMSAGDEVGELGISADGSRIVVAQKASTDAAGNDYWHPYMHIGTEAKSVDLAPATTGALFAGMTADGSKVFFTTPDSLLEADEDTSADLYEANVSPSGNLTLKLLSIGAPAPVGGVDLCNPVANAAGNNWNAVGVASADTCGVVAIAGGGGVAKGDGTIYFLSPERLDGSGTDNQPNLFVVRPGGVPHRVATLEPDNPLVRNAVADSETYRYGDFQVNPGGFAAFESGLSLTGFDNRGRTEVYRYEAEGQKLDCASCPPTGTTPSRDASLSPHGLSLIDDGRVFFTSEEPYVLRDTNERKDAYEWSDGRIQLISTGQSADNSTLLSAAADGTDVFFFTRETLAHEDENGSTVKIYDARAGGGFLFEAPPLPCAASDECHGRGTEPPPAPAINTVTGAGSAVGQAKGKKCKKHFVKRGGKCVKKKTPKRNRARRDGQTGRERR